MTKKVGYRVKLTGDPKLVELLGPFVSENQERLGKARELRRAAETIFGDKVRVEIFSVQTQGEVKAL